LVDVAQDMVINDHDCGTRSGLWIRASDNAFDPNLPQLGERILGRILAGTVIDPQTGDVVLERGQLLDEAGVASVLAAGLEEVFVRSPLTCQLEQGICQQCYGRDLGRGTMVELGTAVGIMAAQSIGEPGTQLTLRTFHTGGIAHGGDITHGLPRVEELLEARKHPKGEAIISDIAGRIEIHRNEQGLRTVKVLNSRLVRDEYPIKRGWKLLLEEGQDAVQDGDVIATRGDKELAVTHSGRIVSEQDTLSVVYDEVEEYDYKIPSSVRLLVNENQMIEAGAQITEGSKNPHTILDVLGRESTQLYLLQEVQKVYRSQGVNIHDKHFEVIVSKMLSRVFVVRSGDTTLLPGDLVERHIFTKINTEMTSEGKEPASARPVLLGITKAALNTESFLASASFQHTIKVLAGAAIEGKSDNLSGLKENVIIGKLIPAGTGFQAERMGPAELTEGETIVEALEAFVGAEFDIEDIDLDLEDFDLELDNDLDLDQDDNADDDLDALELDQDDKDEEDSQDDDLDSLLNDGFGRDDA
jgi:DNA-directed RNA polymerase subunit beta'